MNHATWNRFDLRQILKKSVIREKITLLRANQIAGTTINFKMNIIKIENEAFFQGFL